MPLDGRKFRTIKMGEAGVVWVRWFGIPDAIRKGNKQFGRVVARVMEMLRLLR